MLGNFTHSPPPNIGIVAIEAHIPKKYVNQDELEDFDGVSKGKYTIGLGQLNMAICDDRHDINSICLSVVSSLIKKYKIKFSDIGRLEVGTETIIDKSKSVKTVLMQLFKESGNFDVEGVDTTNACYGATNALFNAVNWIESSYWDGRYALVVSADIAVYKTGNARPTGGAGAVAMLIGPNAPIVFDNGIRASHMDHLYDFYKPDLHSEYPIVDGPLSNKSYITAVDATYNLFLNKIEKRYKDTASKLNSENLADYFLFHSPYVKLVQKSFARLAFNDFKRHPENEKFSNLGLEKYADIPLEETYTNKDMEKIFMNLTKKDFLKKVDPGLTVSKNLGNMYCASLYGGLVSLIGGVDSEDLQNKRIALFSYGSGMASSMFSMKVVSSTEKMKEKLDLEHKLKNRTKITPQEFNSIMELREKCHNMKDYKPVGGIQENLDMWKDDYYLDFVDEKFRRNYLK
ncbi:hypothetical protein HK099_002403, partial [Clydaea vesicula]